MTVTVVSSRRHYWLLSIVSTESTEQSPLAVHCVRNNNDKTFSSTLLVTFFMKIFCFFAACQFNAHPTRFFTISPRILFYCILVFFRFSKDEKLCEKTRDSTEPAEKMSRRITRSLRCVSDIWRHLAHGLDSYFNPSPLRHLATSNCLSSVM